MKERPILFSAPMVRAILEGRKTQTRRIVKPAPSVGLTLKMHRAESGYVYAADYEKMSRVMGEAERIRWDCPHGQPGDRLWVRETFASSAHGPTAAVLYRADYHVRPGLGDFDGEPWRPSIHMPRAASRINLEITGVRVERLHDISEEDAWNEGVQDWMGKETPWKGRLAPVSVHGFAALWEQIGGAGSWEANPWVWVVEFRRIK